MRWIEKPSLQSIFVQAVSVVLIFLGNEASGRKLGLLPFAMGCGLIAGLLSMLLLRHSARWTCINFVFIPLIAISQGASASPLVYLFAFLLLALLNWNSFGDRVPLYLSSKTSYDVLEERLDTDRRKHFKFVDLGCGLSGALVYLSRRFPDANFHGVETAPINYLISKLRSIFRPNLKIEYRNIWNLNLIEFDYVYCFLSPAPMPKIWKKAMNEMKKDAVLISNTFEVPGHSPHQSIALNDWRKSKIHFWLM